MSSMRELTFFLGLQVKQKKDDIFISQDKYVGEILKKFSFSDVKTASTPMETQKPLLKDEDEDGEKVDVHMYRSMIVSLMYLTSSRPDIMFAVCACARYQVNPKVSHLYAMKRIFSARNRQWLQIPQQKLSMWLLQVAVDKCFGFRINYLIMEKAKKSVRLMMEKLVIRENRQRVLVRKRIKRIVDGKKIIVTEASVRRDLQLNDEEDTDCLPNATIFEELTRMGYEKLSQKLTFYKAFFSPQWKFHIHTILQCLSAKTTAWNEFSSTMASAIICLATNQKFNFSKYIFESMVKNLENMFGKFLMKPKRKDTEVPQPSGPTNNVIDEAVYEEMDDSLERAATTATSLDVEQDRGNINNTQSKATLNEPSSLGTSSGSGHRRQETIGDTIAQTGFENVSKTSNDSLLVGVNAPRSDEDSLKLKELMELCVGLSRRVESSDEEVLGEEDVSKQGRIDDIDANEDIYLVNVHRDEDMFRVNDLEGDEVIVETEVASKDMNLSVDEVTLAQAVATLKSAKPKADKAKGLLIHEEEQATTPTVSSQQPSQLNVQDKGKGKMVEPEPVRKLSKKDQVKLDKELAFKLQAEEEEEERLTREKAQQIKEANIVSWDNVQAMIDVDYQMAQQMQAEEQENLSIEEKSKLFVQLLEAKKKHFAAIKEKEKRNKPPNKAQKRNTIYEKVNTFVDIDTELVEGSEVRAEAKIAQESSSKRAGTELEQESIKKQKVDEDNETAELQRLIKVVPDKEEVAIDAIPLETKPPSIGDLKTMFDLHVEDQVWRNQQDYRVLAWKLYDSCGVHSLRKQNVHIHMLVEKRYPFTPATITDMLNRKLQADHWNEMCYHLLKLLTKQLKNQ
ncbi:hypothetical protein Tco_0709527 [Tanacetum coccineum]